jgi:hypothetical protein
MNITCINLFSVCLQNRNGSVVPRVLNPEMLAYHVLRGLKFLLESMGYDVLDRIGTTFLNIFMETARWEHNAGCPGDGLVSRVTFSMLSF